MVGEKAHAEKPAPGSSGSSAESQASHHMCQAQVCFGWCGVWSGPGLTDAEVRQRQAALEQQYPDSSVYVSSHSECVTFRR
jgi:hypothetical protein